MPPTAIITQPIANVPFGDLPANVGLDGTSSTASAGSIVAWEWTIRWRPEGSAAALSGATTSTPTLQNVDIPGTYVLDLNVQQTDLTWAWDHDDPDAWLTLPVVMPTARVYVVATTQYAELETPGLAERHDERVGSATNLMGKWAGLFNEVDSLRGDLDGFMTGAEFENIYVDNIYELTPAHDIVLKNDVSSEGTITIANGESLVTRSISTPLTADLTISASDDISLSAADALDMGGGGAVSLTAGAGQNVTVSAGDSVIVRGGAGDPDLKVNVISEDTAAAGVTIDSVLVKDGAVTTTGTGAGGFVATDVVSEVTGGNGVRVDALLIKDGGATTTPLGEVKTNIIVGGNTLGTSTALSITTSGLASMTVDSDGALSVKGNGTVVLASDSTDLDIDAATSIDIATANGSITMTANGAGRDITLQAADDITLNATGQTNINYAVFTGTSAANSVVAIAAITADDSGAVGINLDGTGDLIVAQAATVRVPSGGTFETNAIVEATTGSGVTIENIRLENEGSNVYALDVGNASSTLNITGNTDSTAPYALTANLYGDLEVFGGSSSLVRLMTAQRLNVTPAGTGEETLLDYSLPANALSGCILRITAILYAANNGNTKAAYLRIGTTGGTALTAVSTSVADEPIIMTGYLQDTGTNTQWGAGTTTTSAFADARTASDTLDETAVIHIYVRGHAPTTNTDLTLRTFIVERLGAP